MISGFGAEPSSLKIFLPPINSSLIVAILTCLTRVESVHRYVHYYLNRLSLAVVATNKKILKTLLPNRRTPFIEPVIVAAFVISILNRVRSNFYSLIEDLPDGPCRSYRRTLFNLPNLLLLYLKNVAFVLPNLPNLQFLLLKDVAEPSILRLLFIAVALIKRIYLKSLNSVAKILEYNGDIAITYV